MVYILFSHKPMVYVRVTRVYNFTILSLLCKSWGILNPRSMSAEMWQCSFERLLSLDGRLHGHVSGHGDLGLGAAKVVGGGSEGRGGGGKAGGNLREKGNDQVV